MTSIACSTGIIMSCNVGGDGWWHRGASGAMRQHCGIVGGAIGASEGIAASSGASSGHVLRHRRRHCGIVRGINAADAPDDAANPDLAR